MDKVDSMGKVDSVDNVSFRSTMSTLSMSMLPARIFTPIPNLR